MIPTFVNSVFFIRLFLLADYLVGGGVPLTSYEARSGSSLPHHLLMVWNPGSARRPDRILHISIGVVSTKFC